jgi:hypothetical protein
MDLHLPFAVLKFKFSGGGTTYVCVSFMFVTTHHSLPDDAIKEFHRLANQTETRAIVNNHISLVGLQSELNAQLERRIGWFVAQWKLDDSDHIRLFLD